MIPTDEIIQHLRQRGERITIQRRMVIETLNKHGDHLTVQAIHEQLQTRGAALNEPTVYRIVQWLKDLGVVSQTDLGQSGIVYQIIGDYPHHHLVCLSCGAIIDVDDSVMIALRDHLRRAYHFEPRIDHMAIFGLCQHCQVTVEDELPAQ
jgi:Fur family ferric uptake transcriptional regulator